MRRLKHKAAVIGCVALLWCGQALAADAQAPAASPPDPVIKPSDIMLRIKPDELLTIFEEVGWSGKLTATESGTPVIVGNYTDPDSKAAYEFQAGLYRCDGDKGCFDIVFTRSYTSGKPVTMQMVNDYNRNQLFGCAYLQDDGRVGLSLSHTVQGGVTRQTVKEIIDWWRDTMVNIDGRLETK